MKKISVITLNGLDNYGNRLQNYALVKYINDKFECECKNVWKIDVKEKIKNYIKFLIPLKKYKRLKNFANFNKLIKTKRNIEKDDFCIVGSDQVWNPEWAGTDELLLINNDNINKISYAASFGVSQLSENKSERYKNAFKEFKNISVREEKGKEIIEGLIERDNIEVLIDPTMLLTDKEWDNVSKKPKFHNDKKYILTYFLGKISQDRKKIFEKFAKDNDCEIINLLDVDSKYYTCGPAEFLWLEKNAYIIFTDSFHSAVFSVIFNRPFVVFDREQEGMGNMNSRIDTLINKFKLENRKFNGKDINNKNLMHNYEHAYEILEIERERSNDFLNKSLI